jgi:hypothetical protein
MSVPNQLEQSVARLSEASARIETARQGASSPENLREWLQALTDFAAALADIQTFNNESVHEKLHDLAARAGLKSFPGGRARPLPD